MRSNRSWLRRAQGRTKPGSRVELLNRFEGMGVDAQMLPTRVDHLADYFAVLDGFLTRQDSPLWFRGHADLSWTLAPSALRPEGQAQREVALGMLADFRRSASLRLPHAPSRDDDLEWLQVAQHYGLPTRLLDWTENAAVALYFACLRADQDGVVFMLDPVTMNAVSKVSPPRILDAARDRSHLMRYMKLRAREAKNGTRSVAIQPIVASERIQLQRGTFTLHGTRRFGLDSSQAPSLAAIPIRSEAKERLLTQLRSIGVDEMALFPEAEHISSHLKRVGGMAK